MGTITEEQTMTFAEAKLWKLNNQLYQKKIFNSSLQLANNNVLEIDDNYFISKFEGHMLKIEEKKYHPSSRNCQFLIPLQII